MEEVGVGGRCKQKKKKNFASSSSLFLVKGDGGEKELCRSFFLLFFFLSQASSWSRLPSSRRSCAWLHSPRSVVQSEKK